ncbi:MAG: YhbY family RNA-binding protein [Methanoregulaceae archaeon]
MSGGREHKKEKPDAGSINLHDLKPTVWIGKQGCTESTLQEIRDQIKKRQTIKVKWLQSTEVEPEALALATGTKLVQVRGKTIILTDKRKPLR